MADNVTTPFGQFKSDDVSGLQVQYIKLMDGTADGAAVIPGDATNGLDVDSTRAGGAGASIYRNLDVGTTGQVIKASAGKVVHVDFGNQAAAKRYLKFYNKATAPTSGDTPVITFVLPASGTGVLMDRFDGAAFATGISVRASNLLADNDNTAPTANDVVINVHYY